MENTCIFCKIATHKIPKEFTYEDESVMVFPDIHPIKPIHLLVVPKAHIADFLELEDSELVDRLRMVAQKMIMKFGLSESGFRLSTNGGGAEKIHHLHFHLLGPMGKAV